MADANPYDQFDEPKAEPNAAPSEGRHITVRPKAPAPLGANPYDQFDDHPTSASPAAPASAPSWSHTAGVLGQAAANAPGEIYNTLAGGVNLGYRLAEPYLPGFMQGEKDLPYAPQLVTGYEPQTQGERLAAAGTSGAVAGALGGIPALTRGAGLGAEQFFGRAIPSLLGTSAVGGAAGFAGQSAAEALEKEAPLFKDLPGAREALVATAGTAGALIAHRLVGKSPGSASLGAVLEPFLGGDIASHLSTVAHHVFGSAPLSPSAAWLVGAAAPALFHLARNPAALKVPFGGALATSPLLQEEQKRQKNEQAQ